MGNTLSIVGPKVQSAMCTLQSVLQGLEKRTEILRFKITPLERRHEAVGIEVTMFRKSDGKEMCMYFHPSEIKNFKSAKITLKNFLKKGGGEIDARGNT